MTVAEVFQRLATRRHDRRTSAQEQIEVACRKIAAGETFDPAGVDDALLVLGLSLDGFKERVDFQIKRRESVERLERLATARNKQEKATAQLEAERKKFEEIAAAHRSRCVAIAAEIKDSDAAIAAAEDARSWLLDREHVPLQFRDSYGDALDRQQSAKISVGQSRALVRECREQISSEAGWIAQINRSVENEIHEPQIVSGKQRAKLAGAAAAKAQEHEAAKARWERRLVDAEAAEKAAIDELEAAEAAVADLQRRILKAS